MNQELAFHAWYDANLPRLLKGNLHDALAEAWQTAELAKPQPAPPNLDAIKAEAETFFEWPSGDRRTVLTTSAIIFARHCAAKTANGTWP
jgi:hypothetical protein